MEEIFGLPAHPFFIHFPIVAIPTATVLAFVAVARTSFRERFGKAIYGLTIITAISAFLAVASGEALADTYANTDFLETHRTLGETLRIVMVGLVVAFGVLLSADTRRAEDTSNDPLTMFGKAGVLVLAVLSTIWTIRTGHEGASLRWGTG